ncbi:UDP-N-acetylmuramoyl-tripeptide--D-alanyl-D-alanine ligase [Aequorivita echinoideorum]|uniref:UDP-N-acetylmuramoyl-tripeptide--D-alanyl-D-alanine ligase n=1 Tax=Aequorivita echinoideorum TaxID=1549647 RepID=A0ABS5S2Q9_9FLAO|nr:UDP-N-acetylmuramoyl-tripeptide--D-alanyl-D-alanine ligase [Aequorivita echinoideorum]MBT0607491.1 UDP-N-acetylmuramoyl-tripeptide--D-alanyl-D-alanine ligase [Aequorivita echinoideorum]
MNIEQIHKIFLESSGVSTDTRKIFKNCIFFALKGENFNGNQFAQEALDKGALKVIVDEPQFHKNTGETILVKNVLLTLQQLANFHRKFLGTNIISLTGSNGKTTTKELINAVLSQKYKTTATTGNLNNHIGVPLTLLGMDESTEIGIVEMGANHHGEIALLCEIAQPDFGYITNFGKAHLEGFGSVEGVIKAKSELYNYIRNNGKTVFVNADDEKQMVQTEGMQRITFGHKNGDYLVDLADASSLLVVSYRGTEIHTNLVGSYNFPNISAAVTIGDHFKIPIEKIKTGIEGYISSNNRSQLIKKGSCTILMDAYNANPTSMLAALENFKNAKGDNKILFLGDMFELGKDAEAEHESIVDYISSNQFGKFYLVGSNFFKTKSSSNSIEKFETFEDLVEKLQKDPPQHSEILIKASRGMALERILEYI